MDKEKKLIKKFTIIADQEKPKPKIIKNCIWAFMVGGIICTLGQVIIKFLSDYDFNNEQITTICAISLVFLGALFTGIGVYDKLAEKAGAGTVVPITGFSNAIVSSAIEYKKEGFVFGVAARMFNIAGPVLVYGIGSSVIIGIIHYLVTYIF